MRPLKLSQRAFCIGLPGVTVCQAKPSASHQASTAFEANLVPLSELIVCGLPRRATSAVSSRTTRLPGDRRGIMEHPPQPF